MVYEDQSVEEAEKISKINSAALINLRLNSLWNDCNNHARSGQFSNWNNDLDCIWRELGGDVKEDGKREKTFYTIESSLQELFKGIDLNQDGFISKEELDKTKMSKLYMQLSKKELFLRRLMNKQGKGSAYQEEADWD